MIAQDPEGGATDTRQKARSDRFGNQLDPVVGYARGNVLKSSLEESLRLQHARRLIARRVADAGPSSIHNFTGNSRVFPISPEDLRISDEWSGPAAFQSTLEDQVLKHLGGSAPAEVAVFNRTSAGLIAAISALAEGGSVTSFTARNGATHPSVIRGARIAGARFAEVVEPGTLSRSFDMELPQLLVVTPVSSELDTLADEAISAEVELAHKRGIPVLLDDAYGARLRPILGGGPKSLQFQVDLAISNSDKAGIFGPRAGFMAGRADLIRRTFARGVEFGLEARTPVALGVCRALERFSEAALLGEVEAGLALVESLSDRLGQSVVRPTKLGPLVHEDDILGLILQRSGSGDAPRVVPAEASAALGILLLEDYGILTVNAAGAPGARVSLRLKPVPGDAGPLPASDVAAAVDATLTRLSGMVHSPEDFRSILFGGR